MTEGSGPPSRVMLITGATGFIGSRLAALALAKGYSVKTLTRSDWARGPAVPIEQRCLGKLPWQIPGGALHGVNVVVHCAVSLESSMRRAYAVNVEGTARLAELGRDEGAENFIFLSSQSARSDAISSYGSTKYAAEQRLLEMSGLRVIIVRPGLVTGPGGRGLFERLRRTVTGLPVIPLLGRGREIVQPIHVDDLCAAIFRCDQMAPQLDKTIVRLGDPQGISLAEFLQKLAISELGRRKTAVSIPLLPVEIAVKAAEAIHFPLPISTSNLQGMKSVAKMETAADVARLGLSLRSVEDAIRGASDLRDGSPISLKERAVRVLLVGAGRVGLVHALTLSRLRGAVLSGVVDSNAGATGLLRGMGVSCPMFKSFDEALVKTEPDAVVIATPSASHLPLTRAALSQGLAVMVEKPLAFRREQLAEYERLVHEFPDHPVQVGYVVARSPQVFSCLDQLRAGRFGAVRGFSGFALISLIQQAGSDRWEVKRAISGGGALINSGGHVLSVIRAAFGAPVALEAERLSLYSTQVEDSIAIRFKYPEFEGELYSSWSIGGYGRQANALSVETGRGRLILGASMGVFVSNDGDVEVVHQLDFDVGFNLAPDNCGAGFTTELNELRDAARTGRAAPMNLTEAAGVEHIIFNAYDRSREVKTFSRGLFASQPLSPEALRLSAAVLAGGHKPRTVRRVLDLRDLSVASAKTCLRNDTAESAWDEYLLMPDQVKGLPADLAAKLRLRVTVPDFLAQSRLLSMRSYRQVLRQMGFGGIIAAARAAAPLLATERGLSFWVAATSLLAAALHAIPSGFDGALLLHGYLTDFALALDRMDNLEAMLKLCRKTHPRARIGFHTNIAAEALNALAMLDTRVDEISVLTSPNALNIASVLAAMRRAGVSTDLRLTAEVGPGPAIVHRLASLAPERWTHGADAILVDAAADPVLAGQRRSEIEQEWARAFPGLEMPDSVP